MSKPDEISQAAWDEGMKEARFYADWLHAGNSSGSVSPHAVTALADTIARAIIAAEKRGEERERADAQRWRAFISSDRFYVMGSAGFTAEGDVNPDRPDQGNWLHFTLNVWDAHPAGNDRQGTHGRKLLLAYVDHMVARRAAAVADDVSATHTFSKGS